MSYQPSVRKPIGTPFIELQSVDSTNNYALAQVHAGLAQHGAVFFAHEQVEGKGQRGKSWTSGKDTSVILTIVVNPQSLLLSQQFQLSACVAISIYEFFSRYAGDATSIKWPNDLYWQDRKAGGVLIESIVGSRETEDRSSVIGHQSSHWQWAAAGIGININQTSFPEQLKNPVSLKQITGKEFKPVEMAKDICLIVDRNLKTLLTYGFKDIYTFYNNHLYKKNEPVKLKKDNRVFDALIRGVSETGALMASHATEEEFDFGEVEWLIPASAADGI